MAGRPAMLQRRFLIVRAAENGSLAGGHLPNLTALLCPVTTRRGRIASMRGCERRRTASGTERGTRRKAVPPVRSDPASCAGSPAWRYLTEDRAIPMPIVIEAVRLDLLREGPRGSMWARHTNAAGVVLAARSTVRNGTALPPGDERAVHDQRRNALASHRGNFDAPKPENDRPRIVGGPLREAVVSRGPGLSRARCLLRPCCVSSISPIFLSSRN